MIPGLNPKMMKQLMKQLNMQEIPAEQVIIKTADKEIVINNPEVMKLKIQGKTSFQITGETEERELKIEISPEDIKLVMEKTGIKEDSAREALETCNGDIAEAILLCEEMKNKK